jgi:hypothetical protein
MPTGTAVRWPLLDADYGVVTLVARKRASVFWLRLAALVPFEMWGPNKPAIVG